jgi:prolyl-tRNA synthetase
VQVVVTPIWKSDAEKADVLAFCAQVVATLKPHGIRVKLDDRDMKPGAKYYEWERKGVPLRLEVGPRDMKQGSVFAASRTGGKKESMALEGLAATVRAKLDTIQADLYARALAHHEARTFRPESYAAMKDALDGGGFFLVPWHDDAVAEGKIKEETRATIRCYPIDGQAEAAGRTCFYSGRPATHMAIFARAY